MKKIDRYQNGPSTPRSSIFKGLGRSTMVFQAPDDSNDPIKHPELLATELEWKSNADLNLNLYDKMSDWFHRTKRMRDAIILKD
jgi:hypothetical protein